MAKIRLGIIGTGGMANQHAIEFAKSKNVAPTACFDTDKVRARAFAEKHGYQRVATSVEELLSDVDAVTIVTPDKWHSAITLQSFAAGKHVLCEKPLTATLDEAREVAAAATKASANGQIHMINFSYRASSAFQKCRELVRAGSLGELRHVHSYYLQSWLRSAEWGSWDSDKMLWRLSRASGSAGVLGDLGCHLLDLTTAASADIDLLRCSLHSFPKITSDGLAVTQRNGFPLDANDTALIEFQLAGGAVGQCQTTRWATGHLNSLRVEIHGTEGAARFDLDQDYHVLDLCLGAAIQKAEWTAHKLKPTPTNYERFIHAIESGEPDQPDILRGAQIQAYLEGCKTSADSGRWESVPSWS